MPPGVWRTAGVIGTHAVSVAVLLGLMWWAKESPRPAIYGIFVNYFYRLVTLYALHRMHAAGPGRALARLLTRPPHPQRPSIQIVVVQGPPGPAGLGVYLVWLAVIAFFSLVLINSQDENVPAPAIDLGRELRLGFLFAFVWWLLDLADRRITLRFDQDLPSNFGYNSTEAVTLALTTLTGGVASAAHGSAWPYLLVFIFLKTLYDIWDEVKFPRGEHPAPDRSAQSTK